MDDERLGLAQGGSHERRTRVASELIFNVLRWRNQRIKQRSLLQNIRRWDETLTTRHTRLWQRTTSVLGLRKVFGMSDALG